VNGYKNLMGFFNMYSKLFLTLSVLLVSWFVLFSCDNENSTDNYDSRPIVCFGDSQTAGQIGNTVEPKKSYPVHLQNKVKVSVINSGKSGDRASNAISRINSDVLSKDPHIVIIGLGGNDLVAELFENSTLENMNSALANIQDDLQAIIDSLKNENWKLYLIKFYTREMIFYLGTQFISNNQELLTTFFNLLDGMYNNLATSNNIGLIDALTSVYDGHMSDLVHPDAEGYVIMADNIFNEIKPYLQANNLLK
jgi:lysophospholipase L1-like esterase